MTSMLQLEKSKAICLTHNTHLLVVMGREICPECAKQLVEQTKEDDKVQQAKRWLDIRTKQAFFPDRHAECTLKSYIVSNAKQQLALEVSVNMAKSLVNRTPTNLILVGNTGTGKTHLGCGIGRFLLRNNQSVRYITSADISEKIMGSWSRKDQTEQCVINDFADYDLLIIDEVGLHDSLSSDKAKAMIDMKKDMVHKVLYKRYDKQKSTILISNLDQPNLKTWMGDRLWSRYQDDHSKLVECIWDDYRVVGGVA